MTPIVSACVAATRPQTLRATLRSLRAQTYADWELVLVAQGDVDAIHNVATEEVDPGRLRFIAMHGRGLSRARNAGLRAARGDIIAMTDDDCEADPAWLAELAARFSLDPELGFLGGAVEAPLPLHRSPRNCPRCEPREAAYDPRVPDPSGVQLIGANFAVRRSTAERVGPFDEVLGAGAHFAAGEDTDYLLRAAACGICMRTTPRARVRHTFGWRYGVRAVMGHQAALARGNGALAAKLTLAGDPGGERALEDIRRLARRDWLERRRPIALPAGIRRLRHFVAGYRECLSGYRLDSRNVLVPSAESSPR